eukprot:g4527.t1
MRRRGRRARASTSAPAAPAPTAAAAVAEEGGAGAGAGGLGVAFDLEAKQLYIDAESEQGKKLLGQLEGPEDDDSPLEIVVDGETWERIVAHAHVQSVEGMTVAELRARLEERGHRVDGKARKADLVGQLEAALEREGFGEGGVGVVEGFGDEGGEVDAAGAAGAAGAARAAR